ncbi:hypothetical protein NPIL_116161, partial [Nephila pilipes]
MRATITTGLKWLLVNQSVARNASFQPRPKSSDCELFVSVLGLHFVGRIT